MRRVLIALCLLWGTAAGVANASTIQLTVGAGGNPGDYILGESIPPIGGMPGGQTAADVLTVNTLLQQALGTWSANNQFYRSTTDFGLSYPADAASALNANPVTTGGFTASNGNVAVNLATNYMYLVATWDGNNAGAQVWYIGDIAAGTTLLIPYVVNNVGPGNHLALDNMHELTHYTLLNPSSVTEGGSTAVFVGMTLMLLVVARRQLM